MVVVGVIDRSNKRLSASLDRTEHITGVLNIGGSVQVLVGTIKILEDFAESAILGRTKLGVTILNGG